MAGGIGKGKLYFLLLKSVKCHEGPLGQRKVSELICRELKVEVEIIFSLVHVLFYHFILIKPCDYNIGFCYF